MSKTFLVGYDLRAPGQEYPPLTARLLALGARRILLSQWVVVGNFTAAQLRDDLIRFIDSNDRLLVVQFGPDWAAYNAMPDGNTKIATLYP